MCDKLSLNSYYTLRHSCKLLAVMYFRYLNVNRFLHSLTRFSKSSNMNSDKCYFRYIDTEDKIQVSFLFKVKDSVRLFNFSRKPSENLQTLCMRIATNVNKVCNKKKKKGNSEQDVDVKILDNENKPISTEHNCLELFTYEKPLKLVISEQSLDVVLNAPWIINVTLPKCLMVGFPILPENLETLYTDNELNIYNWYRAKVNNSKGNGISDLHLQWEFIVNSFQYTPSSQDVGMKLKLECIPVNSKQIGPVVECISKNVIEIGPGLCPFETRHTFTSKKLSGKSFRCVSYNILADLYCDSDFTRTMLHPYCPPYALQIDYRKQLIAKELKGYNADIICLQEVDSKIFSKFLQPFLATENLDGLFFKKGKTVAEGLACFYNKLRFRKIKYYYIVLAEALQTENCLKKIFNTIKDNNSLMARLLDRSNVASATILQSSENPDKLLIVGNTHLYFKPDADHIRLIQGGIFIYWIREIKWKVRKLYPNKRISIVLCGDFNSVPSCGIYQLYTTGLAPSSLEDWKSNANEAVLGLTLSQDILLDSACGTPNYTNFTKGFTECIDYIFYEKRNLFVKEVVPLPSEEELKVHTALPSVVFPSDHIALISDLEFK